MKFFRKKSADPIDSADFDDYLKAVKGIERDYVDELVMSRRRAWRVAIGSSILSGLLTVGYFLLLPLKTAVPYVLRVDNNTGAVDIVTAMKTRQSTYGEVVDKYFLARYVIARESYNFQSIQSDYDTVNLMSTKDVAQDYNAIYSGETARQNVLKDNGKRVVRIISVVPSVIADPSSDRGGTATVRYVVSETGKLDQNLIATITYRYVNAPIEEAKRLLNPLGFQVTSFRADIEAIGQ